MQPHSSQGSCCSLTKKDVRLVQLKTFPPLRKWITHAGHHGHLRDGCQICKGRGKDNCKSSSSLSLLSAQIYAGSSTNILSMLTKALLVYQHLAGPGLAEHWPHLPNSQKRGKFKPVEAGWKICYPVCALSKLPQGIQTVNLLHSTQELQNMFL